MRWSLIVPIDSSWIDSRRLRWTARALGVNCTVTVVNLGLRPFLRNGKLCFVLARGFSVGHVKRQTVDGVHVPDSGRTAEVTHKFD